MSAEVLDDMPSSVTIGQLIGGLADMALTLNGYSIAGYDHSNAAVAVWCSKCAKDVFSFGDMTALEFLNTVLEHNEVNHRDASDVSQANGSFISGLIPTRSRDEDGYTTTGGHDG